MAPRRRHPNVCPQNQYTAAIPLTLASDMLRLAKLAKITQVDIAASVHRCCSNSAGGDGGGEGIPESGEGSGGSSGNSTAGGGPFDGYNGGALEQKINQTTVNTSSIVAGLPPLVVDESGPPPPPTAKLVGRLINSGGITGCKVGRRGMQGGGRRACLRASGCSLVHPAPCRRALQAGARLGPQAAWCVRIFP